MKNIHVLPTDKRSRLRLDDGELVLGNSKLCQNTLNYQYQNIYITSNEEIKEGDWVLNIEENTIFKPSNDEIYDIKNSEAKYYEYCKKIILTTDQDLIANGVQAVDDEFLQWFVKNPSCEKVEVTDLWEDGDLGTYNNYQIIIPQEEPKTNLEKLPFPELVEELANYYKEVPLVEESKQETLNVKQNTHFVDFNNPNSDKISSASTTVKQARFKEAIDKLIKLNRQDSFYEGAKWQAERMYSGEEVIAIVEKSRETGLTVEYLLLTEQFKKK